MVNCNFLTVLFQGSILQYKDTEIAMEDSGGKLPHKRPHNPSPASANHTVRVRVPPGNGSLWWSVLNQNCKRFSLAVYIKNITFEDIPTMQQIKSAQSNTEQEQMG